MPWSLSNSYSVREATRKWDIFVTDCWPNSLLSFPFGRAIATINTPKKKGWCPSVGWHNLVHWKQLKPIALNTARPRPPQKTDSAPAMSLSVTSPGSPCAWPWTPWRPSPAWRRLWERHRGPRHRQGPQIQMNGIMPRQLVWLPSGS